jgi:hypothetical protein
MSNAQIVTFEPSLLANYGAEIVKQIAEKSEEYSKLTRVAELERQAEIQRRLDALRPDAEKIHVFAKRIGDVMNGKYPDISTPEAVHFLASMVVNIDLELSKASKFGKREP